MINISVSSSSLKFFTFSTEKFQAHRKDFDPNTAYKYRNITLLTGGFYGLVFKITVYTLI